LPIQNQQKMLTFSEENYLKIIYQLSENGLPRISTSAIATEMNVSSASVTEKLQRLAEKKWIDYEKSKGVALTDDGQKIALKVIRKHRIWETFLVRELEFGWDEVHEIAEQLEHIQSDKLIERIEKHLGFPRFDPHGEPIPDAFGNVNKPCFVQLSTLFTENKCRITGVKEDSAAFLQLFKKLGLAVGDRLEISEIETFDQSFLVKINEKKQVHLGREVAQNILVTMNEHCCIFDLSQRICPK
jgi:DtxR family transcriptional regulator, Mn-dependent transcriptional regulator